MADSSEIYLEVGNDGINAKPHHLNLAVGEPDTASPKEGGLARQKGSPSATLRSRAGEKVEEVQ